MAKSPGVANPMACATGITGVAGVWSYGLSPSLRAKRSNPFFLCAARWIASVATLLAMTIGYTFAFSRRDAPGVLHFVVPPKNQRAQGKPGTRCTRGLACNDAKAAHTSIQVQRRHSDFPCAMALRLMPCSPRRRVLFLSPSLTD